MASSKWPAVVDALLTQLGTGLDVPVWGCDPSTDDLLNGVIVGGGLEAANGRAGTLGQNYHDLGPTATRDEVGVIFCVAQAETGDDDVATVRSSAFAMLADVEDVLRTGVHLGLDDVLRVEVTASDPEQGYTPDGAFCYLPFNITYTAII